MKSNSKMFTSMMVLVLITIISQAGISYVNASDNTYEPTVLSRNQASIYDITASDTASKYIDEALQRWQKYGIEISAADIKVYNFGTPDNKDLLIIPSAMDFTVSLSMDKAADVIPSTAPQPTHDTREAQAETTPNAIQASWQQVAQNCLARFAEQGSEMDSCYTLSKLSGDTDATKDFFTLNRWATGIDKLGTTLDGVSIDVTRKSTSSPMTWVDWTPRGDISLPVCNTSQFGITVAGIGYSKYFTVCETWDITKFVEAGKFKNTWLGHVDADREVQFMVSVSVPQNGWPIWELGHHVW